MSKLRPELNSGSTLPCMTNGTAYLMIYTAVQHQEGLVHGRLDWRGAHCAIGSYFADHDNTALPESLIDEVAAVNDSVPSYTMPQRKTFVARWLKWKLQQLNFPMGPGRKIAKP
jgi:hypothetical protein